MCVNFMTFVRKPLVKNRFQIVIDSYHLLLFLLTHMYVFDYTLEREREGGFQTEDLFRESLNLKSSNLDNFEGSH
jgi:hypothetical protein